MSGRSFSHKKLGQSFHGSPIVPGASWPCSRNNNKAWRQEGHLATKKLHWSFDDSTIIPGTSWKCFRNDTKGLLLVFTHCPFNYFHWHMNNSLLQSAKNIFFLPFLQHAHHEKYMYPIYAWHKLALHVLSSITKHNRMRYKTLSTYIVHRPS